MRLAFLLFAWLVVGTGATRTPEIPFQKIELDTGANETAAFADINGDGRPDIVSGENWYENPTWKKHRFRELPFDNNYLDDFSDLPLDADGDGKVDIVSCQWFGQRLSWWKNPGAKGDWKNETIESGSPIEFCFAVDLDNDGKAVEILPQFGNDKMPLAWYEAKGGKWTRHIVSPRSYGHGIGVGDVNGDGRNDILTPQGWLEAPAEPRSGDWVMHKDWSLDSTGFLHVYDVNGDGKPDIVGGFAHNYGIFWLEKTEKGYEKRMIDESWSQPHALTLVDLNGDGRKDILTGKRYMAHNGRDPGEREPLGIYWYELAAAPKPGTPVVWVRHVIDYSTRTGGGMQIPVADIDKDGDLDFACAGKSGLYLFLNRTK